MTQNKKLTGAERRNQIHLIVEQCKKIAANYVQNWKPQNPSWEIVDGCAYLRLSTEDQVAVEKGSLEQQIHIAVAESLTRSTSDSINYRIQRFFIEPGITGRHDNRPEFIAMKQDIERRKYKFVVFKELARIARETAIWKEFFRLCNSKNTEIFIRNFPINPNDPTQILQLDILAAFAEYESNQTSRRVRESTYSAMITSGKFNCTKPTLGLDQLVVGGEPKAGLYVRNEQELKTVEWLMEKFVLYGSYQKLLEECERVNVTNKNGKKIIRSTLQKLLTNKKYIGKWEVNAQNRGLNSKKLMPYERFAEVTLPHGPVVDLKLWERVQATVARIAGNKDKNTKIKKIFLLSGILKHQDGSTFCGTGATGRKGRKDYYYNSTHKIRLSADALEEEAKRTVTNIIRNSNPFQDALYKRSQGTETLKSFLDSQIKRLSTDHSRHDDEKRAAARRFDLLSTDASEDDLGIYRAEYKLELDRIRKAQEEAKCSLESLEMQRQQLEKGELKVATLVARAQEIQDKIQKEDPVTLKNAYRELFEVVTVTPSPSEGVVSLNFVLRGHQAGIITEEEKGSVDGNLVAMGRRCRNPASPTTSLPFSHSLVRELSKLDVHFMKKATPLKR